MKSTLSIFLFCLLIVDARGDTYEKSTGCVGAVYTMSDATPTNQVFIYCIGKDGRLSGKKAINTNGAGVNTLSGDPLNSQGSLVVYSNYLFVVNAFSNSLSMFAINPKDATQLKLISVQRTLGRYPVSVAVNSRYACVLSGGVPSGMRCFSYDEYGLSVVSSFDRILPLEVLQSDPLNNPVATLSQILFSADHRLVIIVVKGFNVTTPGYLLFYQLSSNYANLSSTPSKQRATGLLAPFGMSLVGKNGLLITEGAVSGVVTTKYSSTSGTIKNSVFTPLNPSLATAICWSAYSPTVGNYYVIGAGPPVPGLVELKLNLASTSKPVKIIRYYPISNATSGIDSTIVTVGGIDYLYILGGVAPVILAYRLNGPAKAAFIQQLVVQKAAPNKPLPIGMAAYIQASSYPNDRYGGY